MPEVYDWSTEDPPDERAERVKVVADRMHAANVTGLHKDSTFCLGCAEVVEAIHHFVTPDDNRHDPRPWG